ncbi:Ig-like domain-containing protein [Salegentibacter sp.]|uniref:Ig-like domain-containing protein n=1 Tax=Salegentibacter sp. TaxID=1903072 RepID=UPI0035624CDB
MLKRVPNFLLVIILALGLIQCAKKGMPEGGPEDEKPPEFLRANPENFSTNFNREEIRIYFNEYVKLNKPQEQIIISPPMDPKPSILPMGSARKDIRIEIFDTLQENTTYTINFGKSIVDNNEGNELPYFKYVFSTGDYLDSLSVEGTVSDASLKELKEPVSVFLYEVDSTYSDSIVYKENPRYVTYSQDSVFTFELENLKAGTYRMVAVQDKNANYKFNPKSEKIGFIEEAISLPTDSSYHIRLFKEQLEFSVERPKLLKGNQILFGYEGITDFDSLEINLLTPKPEGFRSRIVKDPKTDSLYYWYNQRPETDSLSFEIVSPEKRDTLFTKISELERDSLKVTAEPTGNIEFDQIFKFRANTPLVESNADLIRILNKDSVEVDFSAELLLIKNELQLQFEKQENNQYQIRALPGALTDLFGKTNDTINQQISTKPYSEYGSVMLRLQNVNNFPIITQLTDLEGEVQAERFSENETSFNFRFLKPGKYLVRVITDSNGNQQWDTGNYLQKQKPEKIDYYNDTLEVRSNWDLNESFILE